MDFSKIDKNFDLHIELNKDDIVWHESDQSPFVVYGAYSTNPYKRIPSEVAKNTSEGVEILHTNTAGIRIRFRTNSPYLAIHVEWDEQTKFPHMAITGTSCFDLYSYNPITQKQSFIIPMCCPVDAPTGFDGLCELSGEMKDYVLNFPLYNNVSKLYIGVKEGSDFEEPAKYINDLPVVFYGSSITQGGCASRPGSSYQNILSRKLNFDFINLGFSGNGKAEDAIVDYMAGLEMSVFVSDYDHNAPDPEYLKSTHYKMYQKIRERHPDVPYIMLTKPDYNFVRENDLRRVVVMESFCKAILGGDKNVYFVDGASIFRDDEFDCCTVDGCHPTDLGFSNFAKALYPTLKVALFGK